jgi:16S rRNA (cytosine1402-N4)-methyltransferase
MRHIPVLREEVQQYLALERDNVTVDTTLGLGGHASDSVQKVLPGGKLIAFDQDERNLLDAKATLKEFSSNIIFVHDNFRHLKTRLTGEGIEEFDAILFDLGLSSPHVDQAERGFSFNKEGLLDMRFDQREETTAAEVINNYSETDLEEIFRKFGEEKFSRKLARMICERREKTPFVTTTDLAQFIEASVPKKRSSRASKAHPATQIFQALRMEVNDEMTALLESLDQAMEMLKIGGRVVVISYHSVEDRVVKHFFQALEKPEVTPEEAIYRNHGDPIIEKITRKPVIPSEKELEENPRSRSAKLRAYKKIKLYP